MKHLAAVAQLGERGTEDPEVAGSIPAGGTTKKNVGLQILRSTK